MLRHKLEKKSLIQAIALERIYLLLETCGKNPKHAYVKKWVELIKKIQSKNKVKLPFEIKAKFCKHCNAFWMEGKNCRKRLKGKMLNVKCLNCGKERKLKLGDEK